MKGEIATESRVIPVSEEEKHKQFNYKLKDMSIQGCSSQFILVILEFSCYCSNLKTRCWWS